MTHPADSNAMLTLDQATVALVRLSACIAGGTEEDVRAALAETARAATPAAWVEELILQSYLFCGFPRTLNAAREWRRASQSAPPPDSPIAAAAGADGEGSGGAPEAEEVDYTAADEATCARVYGRFYERLRHNITELHPTLDRWMIVEGYGKVLSRPQLDLGRRELCIVAACVASGQERQLHSHLHGARNVGVPDNVVAQSIAALAGVVHEDWRQRAAALFAKVAGK